MSIEEFVKKLGVNDAAKVVATQVNKPSIDAEIDRLDARDLPGQRAL